MTNTEARKNVEQLANKYFGETSKKELNSLTPAIAYKDFWKTAPRVMFYSRLSDSASKYFNDKPMEGVCSIETTVENTELSTINNLLLKFEMFPDTSFPTLETIIAGADRKIQKEFIDALTIVDKLDIWVADKACNMITVVSVEWNCALYKDDINLIYKNNSTTSYNSNS